MFKLLQKVAVREKADGTYRARRRDLIGSRFGKKEEGNGDQS
jgi:hypothetical protein